MELPSGLQADAGGRNRTGMGLRPTDFRTRYGFRRLIREYRAGSVWGLDYPFTLALRL